MNDLLIFPFKRELPKREKEKEYKYRKVEINKKYSIWSCGLKLMVGDKVIVRKLHGDKKNWIGTVTRCLEFAETLEHDVKSIILEKETHDES